MFHLTKTQIQWCITALDSQAGDLDAAYESLQAEGLNAWAGACKTRADDFRSTARKLELILENNVQRVAIDG